MTFENLGLSSRTLENVRRSGFVRPTPIQSAAIPVALRGSDLIGCAQTGTGKTAAFVLPILERLAADRGTVALILAPTRELATQIRENFELLSGQQPPKVALILGGLGMESQMRALASRPNVIIATPGRLIDHLDRGTAKLDRVSILVLDEADRMLDMGFAPQVRRILEHIPRVRQTMLFSATMPAARDPKWRELLAVGLKDPVRLSIDPPRVAQKAEQSLWLVDPGSKTPVLLELLGQESGAVLVFTRTKHRADRVAKQLKNAGVSADRIHGDRSQSQRQHALDSFKRATVRVLVATDIAARGIDVEDVAHVVNYDLPRDPEDYVHRVGRTARAEKSGRATSFVQPDERGALPSIERLIGERLPPLEPRGPVSAHAVPAHPVAAKPGRAKHGSPKHGSAKYAAPAQHRHAHPHPRVRRPRHAEVQADTPEDRRNASSPSRGRVLSFRPRRGR